MVVCGIVGGVVGVVTFVDLTVDDIVVGVGCDI